MPAHIKYPVINGLKECGTCHLWKPINEYIKARNHYTASCNSCRRVYAAEYRQRPESKTAALEYLRSYRSVEENRQRLNENTRRSRKRPEAKLRRNETRRMWTMREKQKAVDYKGGKCCICDYDACLSALEFHHLNPSEKEIPGTGALKSHWSFERNKSELDKCVLVCARCHREIHAGLHKGYIQNETS